MSETQLVCQICHQPRAASDGVIAELIRPSLAAFIRKTVPHWSGDGFHLPR